MLKKKSAIALITCHGWIGFSTSVINTAKYWAMMGYSVDIYISNVNKNIPLPKFKEKNIFIVYSNKARHKLFFLDDLVFYLFYFKKKYKYVIGFDARGLVRAFFASILESSKLIYHSLEFYEPKKGVFFQAILKKYEIFCAKYSIKIFTQDELRINHLIKDLNLPREKFDIVYNSPIGAIIKDKAHYFHDMFAIDYDIKLVLVTGSLVKEHCIKEIIESVKTWNDNFVLVLHGIIPDTAFETEIRNMISELPNRIYLSTKLLNANEKDIIFNSVDIGFVGFLPVNENIKYSAGSAGKLFDFMQHGVPIIAFDTPGMKEIVIDNKIGLVFDDWGGISIYLDEIFENINSFSENCYKTFYKYEFLRQYEKVVNKILNIK